LIPISGYAISSDIRDDPAPRHFSLFQNYPNPFNPVTNIRFRISERTFVRLSIFDILGREISVLVNEEQIAGTYEENFSGADFPSGVYFYTLRAGNFSDTKKFILMK
ncbi:MAG: T9SS C-terminal target domain-containing protein, partial [Ignavibacteriales bacterium]